MNIDQRDIEKGSLIEILPKFYPNSISYLSEINEYRMYAEMWSNRRKNAREKRREIGHEGYLKTLEMGERKKRRKSDKVRFDYFVAADSVNYVVKRGSLYGELIGHIQMGGIQTNSIFSEIIKANRHLFEIQSLYPSRAFHSESYLPKTLEINLEDLDLQLDEKSNKYYFEISTNTTDFSNLFQRIILSQILGEDVFSEKLQLLHKVDRKYIRCLFENPEYVSRNVSISDAISRLCVVLPFHETIIVDFAGSFEDYGEACLLGILIKAKEKQIEKRIIEKLAKNTKWPEDPLIDSYA
ncbi:MAG: hypothetical protein SCARUB_02884 [Candidatus Scalindua rubra]|uniref:Uncharacterized protein n=1 Tax=Candidatus Scalindua rubra TaxID=1872076 RepID=A0A1E3X8P4_9BACT|nr:MAG: hypothetical protein SCARUB_02884 [Candidatus Scalindua rubra]